MLHFYVQWRKAILDLFGCINALSDWCSISTLFYEILRIKTIFPYQCPLGLRLHFYLKRTEKKSEINIAVSMPFRAETPFLQKETFLGGHANEQGINALSGWGSISTLYSKYESSETLMYQCPFGLRLYFYFYKPYEKNGGNGSYQCPFGLRLHFYWKVHWMDRNILVFVSMPFRAEAPFLRYPFKNLGFMRFLEPVFAGIYQNILTMTIFRAC